LDHAIKARGGIDEVRRRSTGHPHNFGLEVEFALPEYRMARYAFEIGAKSKAGFFVKQERLEILAPNTDVCAAYEITDGEVTCSVENMPPALPERLYLVTAAGRKEFLAPYKSLLAMGFYNLSPEQMKDVQSPDAGEILRRDGSNIASVVARLATDRPELAERVREYLAAIVPDIVDFERVALGHKETLRFRQGIKGAAHPWRFNAASMSDGTLRALGILVASMQLVDREVPVHLVGIEEPEAALHPAAAGALMDSLREASDSTQILLTTHSPDLLDHLDLKHDRMLIVQAKGGETAVGPADRASLEAIQNHLYSPGDLLRMDQLQPDQEALDEQMELVFA
jgi:hypothetical protein